jgi:poly(3-hydroxyoctanoate) depolymerase
MQPSLFPIPSHVRTLSALASVGYASWLWACGSADSSPLVLAASDAAVEAQPAPVPDAALTQDAEAGANPDLDAGSVPSQCAISASKISCPHQERVLTAALLSRTVQWEVPRRPAPAAGFPVAIVFQGSLFGTDTMWSAKAEDAYGAYYQAKLVQVLLDSGFAVLTPEARLAGSTYWDTNVPPYATFWTSSPDHALMLELFQQVTSGSFGSLDATRMYATGISSGGYMTSRMAEAYPGKFRALAIHSASWATCSGAACFVPDALPLQHPPTLFLHGGQDAVVPMSTADSYYQKLLGKGVATEWVSDAARAHEWLPQAPEKIVAFFHRF